MDHAFSKFHPLISFLYFVQMLAYSMVLMHPLCIGFSLLGAIGECAILLGPREMLRKAAFAAPMLAIAALINPAFNHEGATILTYLPSGNPLTAESLVYGLAAAGMLLCVLLWCVVLQQTITSDRLLCLLGRPLPVLSMIFSMVLRFIPLFSTRLKKVVQAQQCIGRDTHQQTLPNRIRSGIKIFSIMVTWSLESAVETADSMKSRGYGLPGRTAFSVYRWSRRDLQLLALLLVLGICIGYHSVVGNLSWHYFPILTGVPIVQSGIGLLCYLLFCCLPILLEGREACLWRFFTSQS